MVVEQSTRVEYVPGRVITGENEWLWLGWHVASSDKGLAEINVHTMNLDMEKKHGVVTNPYQVYKVTKHTTVERME